MKLKSIGPNQTEIETSRATVLFSYNTPVAACMKGEGADPVGFVRTAKRHSVTTSRHINKWLDGAQATEKPQEYLDGLA